MSDGLVWWVLVPLGAFLVGGAVAAIRHSLKQQQSGPSANWLARGERNWRDG